MRKSRFTEEQIIRVLEEHSADLSAGEVMPQHAISDATFYKWRSRYGGMEISDARKLKALEDENRKLKKLPAESMLDISMLKEMLGKTFSAQLTGACCDLGGPREKKGACAPSAVKATVRAKNRRAGYSASLPARTSRAGFLNWQSNKTRQTQKCPSSRAALSVDPVVPVQQTAAVTR